MALRPDLAIGLPLSLPNSGIRREGSRPLRNHWPAVGKPTAIPFQSKNFFKNWDVIDLTIHSVCYQDDRDGLLLHSSSHVDKLTGRE